MHMKCRTIGILLASMGVVFTTPKADSAPSTSRDAQIQIVADKMCCKGCARKISGQLYAARGVKAVEANLKTRIVSISLPQPNVAMLGQLWKAVEQGEGGPSKLVSTEATYTLIPENSESGQSSPTQSVNSSHQIMIDNLHCKGCANKIAAQLYTIKGVTRVSVDMKKEILFVKTKTGTTVTPWQLIEAVSKAGERPLAIVGPHGKLAIEWTTKRASKNHQQAQQTTLGELQR